MWRSRSGSWSSSMRTGAMQWFLSQATATSPQRSVPPGGNFQRSSCAAASRSIASARSFGRPRRGTSRWRALCTLAINSPIPSPPRVGAGSPNRPGGSRELRHGFKRSYSEHHRNRCFRLPHECGTIEVVAAGANLETRRLGHSRMQMFPLSSTQESLTSEKCDGTHVHQAIDCRRAGFPGDGDADAREVCAARVGAPEPTAGVKLSYSVGYAPQVRTTSGDSAPGPRSCISRPYSASLYTHSFSSPFSLHRYIAWFPNSSTNTRAFHSLSERLFTTRWVCKMRPVLPAPSRKRHTPVDDDVRSNLNLLLPNMLGGTSRGYENDNPSKSTLTLLDFCWQGFHISEVQP